MKASIVFLLMFAALSANAFKVERTKLLRTQKTLLRGWRVTLKINPFGTVWGWTNIFHATLGRDNSEYGDRTPAVYFHGSSTRLHICSAVNGNRNYNYNSKAIPLHRITTVVIQQVQSRKNFQYYYQIKINGNTVVNVLNNDARVFHNVKYYASNPWYNPAKVFLKSVKFRMYKHKGPEKLKRSNLIATKRKLLRGWKVELRINPFGTVWGWTNIFHATLGRDNSVYGDRTPAVYFHGSSTRLHICSAVNGNRNYNYNSKAIPLNRFTRVVIQQVQRRHNHQYYFQIYINGHRYVNVLNHGAQVFNNVKYYASNPWYNPAKASIGFFRLTMFKHKGPENLKKKNLIATKRTLLRGWKVVLRVNPFATTGGWTNIFHATVGRDNSVYGDRTPAVFFHGSSTRLHICSAVNGNRNYVYNGNAIPLHRYTTIVIQQVQRRHNHQYYYQVYINGERFVNVLNHGAKIFHNVKYYASDPWYNPAKATIGLLKVNMFKHKGPENLKKNNLIATRKSLPRGWRVYLEINPFGTVGGWTNIFHATRGRDNSIYGDRTPAIYFHGSSTRLHICSAVNGNRNYNYNSKAIPLHKYTRVRIQQVQIGYTNKYRYQIFINGKRVVNVVNNQAKVFPNVKYYASNPWYTPAKATIRRFRLQMFKHKAHKLIGKKFLGRRRTLPRQWKVMVDINPVGTVNGWSNIFHATTGGDVGKYGYRTPGIWMHSKSTRLHICSAVNGIVNYCYNSRPISFHKFTRVIIQQVRRRRHIYYQVFVNGRRVVNVINHKAQVFRNVKYFASDPWYAPAKVAIRNLKIFGRRG